MTTAWQTLQQGDFSGALNLSKHEIKASPKDIEKRFLLAQLFIMSERPDEAIAALDVEEPADQRDAYGLRYHLGLLRAEQKRLAWLTRGEGSPAFAMPPPEWVEDYLKAHQLACAGDHTGALKLMQQTHPRITGAPGRLNGEVVHGIREGDDGLGPFLEVLSPDVYLLVPFSQIGSMVFSPPTSHPELLWRPVNLTLANGSRPPLRVPTLYAGLPTDDEHRLGQKTSYPAELPGLKRGVGQKRLQYNHPDGSSGLIPLRDVASFEAGVFA